MSIKGIFDNIEQFDSENEEEIDKDKKKNEDDNIVSSIPTKNNKMKESKIKDENKNQQNNKKKPTRDIFGYFINQDEDDEEEENEESNLNDNMQDLYSYHEETDKEKGESLNFTEKIYSERNNSSDDEEDQNGNNVNNNKDEENSEHKKDIENNNNIYNNENKDKSKEDKIDKKYLINDNGKNIKIPNLDSLDGEGYGFMDSFKPNPLPESPIFSKRISNKNNSEVIKDNNNYNIINNDNLPKFTETIKVKIEDNNSIKNKNKDNNIINKNFNPICDQNSNSITNLGKLNNKNNMNIFDSFQLKKIDKNEELNNEDEEKEEEAFLNREELKRQELIKENDNYKKREKKIDKILEKNSEDEGKENVSDDEEEEEKKNSQIKNLNNLKRVQNGGRNEKLKEEITEEEENEIKAINNFNIKGLKKNSNYIITNNSPNKNKKELDYQLNYQQIENKNLNINNNNNIYYKKIAPNENNNKNIKQITPIKRNSKINSSKNKNMKNDINLSSDNKKPILSSRNKNNINLINYNNNNYSKKIFINKGNNLEYIIKNLYSPKYNNKKINYTPEKYPFKPKINQKSKKIWEKRNLSKPSTPSRSFNNEKYLGNDSYILNRKPNTPINVLLYEDANNKKQKMERIYINEYNNIKSKANIKKINNNSYNMISIRINKKIENSIKKYSINGKISIVGVTQCLFELNIINELIKIKNNIVESNEDLDLVELQSIVEYINVKDFKKLEEVEFLEQLWFKTNPSLKKYINSDILFELLKILFSSENNIKEITNNIVKLLNKYNIINNNVNDSYLSPLRNKRYNHKDLWPLSKFVKTFLNIRKNLKAYKENDNKKEKIYNSIKKDREKDLTFKPDFPSRNFFYKYSKYDNDKDISIYSSNISGNTKTSKKSKNDFDKLYERFMAEKELHEKTIEKIRQLKIEKELRKCTKVPKINKYIPRSPIRNSRKKIKTIDIEDSDTLKKNNSNDDLKIPIFQKLYNSRKNSNINTNKIIKDENCTFKPNLLASNSEIMMRALNMNKIKKPKGYNDYVNRNRYIIERKEYLKKKEEDKIYGRNYEKVQKMNINKLNITDLNENNKKKGKINISTPSYSPSNYKIKSKDKINHEISNNNFENEKVKNIIDDIYITIEIKIPNGQLKPLKIYNKNYNDTIEFVNKFCKEYNINEQNKKIILKKVIQYKNSFFGNNNNEIDNGEGIILSGDLETITNSMSNNSNH